MGLDDTTQDHPTRGSLRSGSQRSGPALVLLHCQERPDRVGEVALLTGRGPWVLGRGETGEHLTWARQRPGRTEAQAPLAAASLSRKQLVFTAGPDGLLVQNAGRRSLSVNGQTVQQAVLAPGDTVSIGDQLVVLVTERPAVLPGSHDARFAFGGADRDGIVGESPAAWQLRQELAFAAERTGHVLISGPTGSGKELVARGVHTRSRRGERPLVSRNAATLPEGILDAELFGNCRNYPNPGMPERTGLLGEANRTSLFLDEIGELPEALQAHLLRVLDDGEYTRLGETRQRRTDLRLLCATNRSVASLKFDLAARLELRIEVPSLATRREDVVLVAFEVLRRLADGDPWIRQRFFHDDTPRLSPGLIEQITRDPLEHNVRSLRRLLVHAMASSPADVIEATAPVERERTAEDPVGPDQIRAALDRNGGSRSAAWKELGLRNRSQLYRLLKQHGIE